MQEYLQKLQDDLENLQHNNNIKEKMDENEEESSSFIGNEKSMDDGD